MQRATQALVLLALLAAASADRGGRRTTENPLGKVMELLSELEVKIIKEGEAEQKAYEEFVEWCDDASANTKFEIKTATTKKEKLEATIEKATTDIEASETKIEELAGSIAVSEGELKNATLIREKENTEFVSAEAELVDAIDTLDRAIAIIEREMRKNPALTQVDTSDNKALVQSLTTVIEAAGFTGTDRKKLLTLVQSDQSADAEADDAETAADEAALSAPKATAYKGHSSSIIDVLEDLKEKAETELSDLRKAESSASHNFKMLEQSLTDQMGFDNKDLGEEKASKAASQETKAVGEGDLASTVKDLANLEKALKTAQTSCMTVAADHEATIKSRAEELEALATAKKILAETTAGAVSQSYSLLQIVGTSSIKTRADLANVEVVAIVKRLAKEYHSAALAQLASKIQAAIRFGAASGEDPFAKVKEMIKGLIDRLMEEAASEASEKAYCDKEMAKTEEKKADLASEVDTLSAKIDSKTAASAGLKEDVKGLQAALATLAKQQAEMDKARQEEHEAYVGAKTDLELGLQGVRKALTVLRDYYASTEEALLQGGASGAQPPVPQKHEKAGGAGGGIIGILEVVESDFAKSLAQEEAEESNAQSEYEKMTQENKITKSLREQDVKYMTAEYKGLDKEISELTSDRETASTELSAVLDYYEQLKNRCILKAESYEERKRRREAEIAGLKEALSVLEGEALVQLPRAARRALRH